MEIRIINKKICWELNFHSIQIITRHVSEWWLMWNFYIVRIRLRAINPRRSQAQARSQSTANFKFSSCNLLKWTYLGVVYFLLLYCSFQKFSERLMWLFDELFLAIKVILRWIIKILNKSVNCTWDNQENNHQVLQLSQSSLPLSLSLPLLLNF